MEHEERISSYPREFLNRLGNNLHLPDSGPPYEYELSPSESRQLEFFRLLPPFVVPDTSVVTIILDNRIRTGLDRARMETLRVLCRRANLDFVSNLGSKSKEAIRTCLSLYGLKMGEPFDEGRRRFLAYDELEKPWLAEMPAAEGDMALTQRQKRLIAELVTRTGHGSTAVIDSALVHFRSLVELSETSERLRVIEPQSADVSID